MIAVNRMVGYFRENSISFTYAATHNVLFHSFLLVGVNNLLSGMFVSVQTDLLINPMNLCSINLRRGYEGGMGMSILQSNFGLWQ